MKPPCKDCLNRKAGCHSTCEKYLVYRRELDKLNEIINKQRKEEYAEYSRYMKLAKRRQK